MDKLHSAWIVASIHWVDILIAAIFALVFAVIADLLAIASRIRAVNRHIGNRLAKSSKSGLHNRIKELEVQRNNVALYLSSDKALYLATFRFVIGILLCIVLADLLSGMATEFRPVIFLVPLFQCLAILLAFQGLKISVLDTRAKVEKMLSGLDAEIEKLKVLLESM